MKSIIEQSGFTWVNLPREDLQVFSLLEKVKKKNVIKRLFSNKTEGDSIGASLSDIFSFEGRGVKPTDEESSLPTFKGKDIYNAQSKFSLSGLKGLSVFGKAKADSEFKKVDKLLYEFDKPIFREVNQVELDNFLNRQQPTTKTSNHLKKLRNGELYIVMSVLQAKSFSLQDVSELEIKGSLDMNLLEGYLSKLETSGALSKEENLKTTYKSKTPITFAVKACKLKYEEASNTYHILPIQLDVMRSSSKKYDNELDLLSDETYFEDK